MFIDLIVGARPNFIKIYGIIKELKRNKKINFRLIHTGQHYNKNLSLDFFKQLNLPKPHHNLNAGSGTQAEQTSKIMLGYEKLILTKKPKMCIVVGDVNSTMACAIVAKKFNIMISHIEGGLRSFDFGMPEEVNRVVTDSITDFFFTTSHHANKNLKNIGVKNKQIFFVGNTMIDTLVANLVKLRKPTIWEKLNLEKKKYFLITLHRPTNVDEEKGLGKILETISKFSMNYKLIFCVHPRTVSNINNKFKKLNNFFFVEPQSYLNFLYLMKNSKGVLTDSGGITEEATFMNIPCITFRNTTERPETVLDGTNILIGNNLNNLKKYIKKIHNNKWKVTSIPKKWDGKSSKRIVKILERILSVNE